MSAAAEARVAPRRVAHVALAGAGVLLLLGSEIPLCPLALVAGVPCPACGMTRATFALGQGAFAEAWHLHPLVFVALPTLAVVIATATYRYASGGRLDLPPRLSRALAPWFLALYAALVVLWIARWAGAFGGPVPVMRGFFA